MKKTARNILYIFVTKELEIFKGNHQNDSKQENTIVCTIMIEVW